MNIVFDTSVLIESLRLRQDATELLAQLEASTHTLYVPSIVGFELFAGNSSKNPSQQAYIKEFLQFFDIIDLTWEIAQRAGALFRDGVKGLAVPDYIVAASALDLGATVATLNHKHFSRVPGLTLYPFRN